MTKHRLGRLLLPAFAGPVALLLQGCVKSDGFYIPSTISKPAQEELAAIKRPGLLGAFPAPHDQAAWDKLNQVFSKGQEPLIHKVLARYQPLIKRRIIGGVPVLDIQPRTWHKADKRLLVYFHGGGYTLESAHVDLTGSVPIADVTGIRVISADYTLAPRADYREILRQAIAVINGLLAEGYDLKHMAVYGDSAGGAMAAGITLKMRNEHMGMPAALVLISPWSDITETGDTYHTLRHADPIYRYAISLKRSADAYAPPSEQKNPYVSPVYGDYAKGFPPTLIQGGTKEILLSCFIRQYQAIDQAGMPVKLDLYEGMMHDFQTDQPFLPESGIARRKIRDFLNKYLQ